MLTRRLCIFMLVFISSSFSAVLALHSSEYGSNLEPPGAGMPTVFTANAGQWPDSVLFRAEGGGCTQWFTRTGIYIQRVQSTQLDRVLESPAQPQGLQEASRPSIPAQESVRIELVKAEFLNANPRVNVVGKRDLSCRNNFFLGTDPVRWRTGVHSYSSVVFENLYAGIDLIYSGQGGRIECRINAASWADPSQVQFRFAGENRLEASAHGEPDADAHLESLVRSLPEGVSYKRVSAGVYALEVEADRSTITPLAAAPALSYATYLGGSGNDRVYTMAVDSAGHAYLAGTTGSADFPTQAPYQTNQPSSDAFVVKLSADGSGPVYATYLGGSSSEQINQIVLDNAGQAYVAGATFSTDFPTKNPYQTYQGDSTYYDVFVTKLGAAGDSLVYSTYLGGTLYENPTALVVDDSGHAYVAGHTNSSNFPTQSPYQTYQGLSPFDDAFVAKLSPLGNSLVYSTYLGGTSYDWAYALAVDASGQAFVSGATSSTDFPTQGAYQSNQPGGDAFVAKLNAAGNALVFSTYLGGGDEDAVLAMTLDNTGTAFVAGLTSSADFPTQGSYQLNQDTTDAFVTRLSTAGNSLVYSTYLGGNGYERATSIALDAAGNACVAGYTQSADFPTQNTVMTYQAVSDAFIVRLNSGGNSMLYGTYLGGNGNDYATCLAVDESNSVYLSGWTLSTDFVTQSPYQTDQPLEDAFVVKLSEACAIAITGDVNVGGSITSADVITLVNYVFKSGPAPLPCIASGDVNCSGSVTSADVIALVNFVFKGGTPPCDGCTSPLAAGC